ncbi:hypothetical protein NUW54_g5436 [Trametes sanguinea]|uniref:Uncharacterized protein n=1 Tax=Trametes sanguinea TaxID=158606 RepID=A0ACC1PVM5_9APHY|nr:hypothetical protein NUW54_g5436 [Trametes sanguinea]
MTAALESDASPTSTRAWISACEMPALTAWTTPSPPARRLPIFDFTNVADDNEAWQDQDSDADESDDFDQTGEYTGKFKVLTVPTKADPPSSCTRSRQDAWGHPISPFPGSGSRRVVLARARSPVSAPKSPKVSRHVMGELQKPCQTT